MIALSKYIYIKKIVIVFSLDCSHFLCKLLLLLTLPFYHLNRRSTAMSSIKQVSVHRHGRKCPSTAYQFRRSNHRSRNKHQNQLDPLRKNFITLFLTPNHRRLPLPRNRQKRPGLQNYQNKNLPRFTSFTNRKVLF